MRRPRFLSPQERVKSPPPHPNIQFNRKPTQLIQIGKYLYDSTCVIGKGQYSVVYKGYEQNKQNQFVAVKVITIQPNNPIQMYMIENEINTLKIIDSPYVLKLLDHQQTSKTVFLVTEYCNKGDLLQKIQRSLISEEEAISYTLQIAKALSAIHAKNIMHGDIKSANILLSDRCVVADFGFAQNIDSAQQTFIIGTPLYMAPEVLFENNINCSADIWSLGCVLYEMVFGQSPFYSENNELLKITLAQFREHGKLQFPNMGVSRKIKALIQLLIRVDPQSRLTADNIISLLEPKTGEVKMSEEEKKIKQELQNLDHQTSDYTPSSNQTSQIQSVAEINSTPDNKQQQPDNKPSQPDIKQSQPIVPIENNHHNPSPDEHRRSTKNSNSSVKRQKFFNQLNNQNLKIINQQINTPPQNIQQKPLQSSEAKRVSQRTQQTQQQQQQNTQNNNQSSGRNISLHELVSYFYKVYKQIYAAKEYKLAFIYLKLVNIYYLAYLEEQSKQQKKVQFLSCQNDYFDLEKEIKSKYPHWLREEEFQKIFHSKFVLTPDFLKYSLNSIEKAVHDQGQDEKIIEKLKMTHQIITFLVSNEKSNTLQLDQQIIRLHRLNSKV